MGRPLNKKYFGNRNIGTGGYTPAVGGNTGGDDGIGGEGLASVSTAVQGSININSSFPTFPTLGVSDPELPGGVTAVTAVTWEIDTITISGDNNNYTHSQTGQTATLNGLTGQADVEPNLTIDTNGSGAVTNLHVNTRGTYTDINGAGITTWAIEGAGGNNAQATVKFRVKSIAVTEKGSGYVAVPQLTWSALSGTTPADQTPTLTTDSGGFQGSGNNVGGDVNAPTQQDNAILIHANTTNNGTKLGDIRKQKGSRRYQVRTADGIATVKLVATNSPAVGEAYIKATDDNNNTYFVTKLTNHRAVLSRWVNNGDPWLFAEGESAKWTFGNAQAGEHKSVQIENA